MQVYDSVIIHEMNELKEIKEDKLAGKKSDIEMGEDIESTMLYYLERININQRLITESEYETVKEKYEDVKDVIDTIRGHARYSEHFNE